MGGERGRSEREKENSVEEEGEEQRTGGIEGTANPVEEIIWPMEQALPIIAFLNPF